MGVFAISFCILQVSWKKKKAAFVNLAGSLAFQSTEFVLYLGPEDGTAIIQKRLKGWGGKIFLVFVRKGGH